MRLSISSLFLLFFLLGNTSISFAQCPEGLTQYSVAIKEAIPTKFEFLTDELDGVELLGYGEMTHGTAEASIVAQNLFLHLAKEAQFEVLIIETQMGEGAYFNDYIQGRADDLTLILEEHNSSWRYRTQEFAALLKALRAYNATHDNRLSIYGCEMQYVKQDVQRINAYLENVGNDHRLEGFEEHLWQPISDDVQWTYTQRYYETKRVLEEHRDDFIAASDEMEYWIAYNHLEVIHQFLTAVSQSEEQRKHDLRDLYMTQNIHWIQAFTGSRAVYWAHNAHVGDWVSNGIVDVAGHHLKKIYGDAYYTINMQLGTGTYQAFPPNANEVGWTMKEHVFSPVSTESFTACLQAMGAPNAFVALSKAKRDSKLALPLHQEWTVQASAGAQHFGNATETLKLGEAFDAILYLHSTTPITWLD